MPNILAIESCCDVCSVSVLTNDQQTTQLIDNEQKPSSLLIALCDKVLSQANVLLSEIDYIAYTKGPGAFTGVRLCLGVAQGLSLSHGIKTVGFSTLAVLAYSIKQEYPNSLPALDARMGEVYWGVFKKGGLISQAINQPEDLPNLGKEFVGIGSGWNVYQSTLIKQTGISHLIKNKHPNAQYLAQLANDCYHQKSLVIDTIPSALYLRNNVAKSQIQT